MRDDSRGCEAAGLTPSTSESHVKEVRAHEHLARHSDHRGAGTDLQSMGILQTGGSRPVGPLVQYCSE